MMRTALISFFVLLAGCGGWPDVGGPTSSVTQDWPVLRPIDSLLTEGALPAASEEEADRLARRAAALETRARVLRGSTTDMEALRARLGR
ncbi:MAG: hypothetical protein QNJ20_12970 [Paracoccaceae bacterium]|nr:hypothetical protein [Paracoccaceae bacterium]